MLGKIFQSRDLSLPVQENLVMRFLFPPLLSLFFSFFPSGSMNLKQGRHFTQQFQMNDPEGTVTWDRTVVASVPSGLSLSSLSNSPWQN